MKKIILKNGLTLLVDQRKTDTITVQATVKTGSNNETKGIHGISHFIEHMLFEGTKNRKEAKIISNEIESLGGELNAYTSNERTCFYVKVPKKHFLKALDIVSDVLINPLFDNKAIEKERKIILKEINMVNDEPRFYQWILFQGKLFQKNHTKYPVYGFIQDVNKLNRKDILRYYEKYYVPNNTIISVSGDVKNIQIRDYFINFNKGRDISIKRIIEPKLTKSIVVKEKRKMLNSYLVLGYKTVSRLQKDSYVLDVIKAILGRGQSGRIFEEIRGKRGLAYEVGVHNEANNDYGFFSIYLNTDKTKVEVVKKIILEEMEKLKNHDLTEKELKEAKGYLEGQYILENEDTHDRADSLCFWESIKDANLAKGYLKEIRKVTMKDISKIAKKYFGNYCLAMVEQE
jgi:predicted Zn-dependent peptidase